MAKTVSNALSAAGNVARNVVSGVGNLVSSAGSGLSSLLGGAHDQSGVGSLAGFSGSLPIVSQAVNPVSNLFDSIVPAATSVMSTIPGLIPTSAATQAISQSLSGGGNASDLLTSLLGHNQSGSGTLAGVNGSLPSYTPSDPSTLQTIDTAAPGPITNVEGLTPTGTANQQIAQTLANGHSPGTGGGSTASGSQQGAGQGQAGQDAGSSNGGQQNTLQTILKTAASLAPVLAAASGGGSGGSLGPAAGNLNTLASDNLALSNRLQETALANLGGNIPGPALSALERKLKKKEAEIRDRYAAMGMSGSTAEAQDLAAAKDATSEEQFAIGQQMAQTGLQEVANLTGQSSSIYEILMQAQLTKDSELGNALAAFAGATAK